MSPRNTRSRLLVVAVPALAIAAAIATVALSGAAVTGPAMKTIPAVAQSTLRRSLEKAAGLVPPPEKPYVLDSEGAKLEIDPRAPWDPTSRIWTRPGRATAELYYETPGDRPEASAEERELLGPIEVSIELNGESRLADLGSEGGTPRILPLRDAVVVEISTIVPGSAEERVASMTPRQSAFRPAALTMFIGDPRTEAGIRSALKRGSDPPSALGRARNPATLRLISIRLHGPKEPIEVLAQRIPAASLRALLSR
ncbi:MAG: hypothetical protein E6K77_05495 [Candidatus Eisenbacteria bacterium]|uniref:Uncharacterized protein n=1 Tax=Eiseniibacteriota bacterium TaxID=2212470 RepID=A0A538TIA9_UNCEI|nr:MAG: hypothetical protein E6K77_05495 [Candidatus Eisenbacteria bacterium]